ncbi:MAG TPA: hypothetical protein VNN25_28345 [Thermoanaerobaculia bacterium]|nr:hypothetical protein [Thermoanaerobaculia bacterium]
MRLWLFVIVLFSCVVANAAYVFVTPNNLGSWHNGPLLVCGAPPGTVDFVLGPGTPPLGSGSLQIDIPSNSPLVVFFGSALDGVPLTDLTELRYITYVVISSSPGIAPRLLLSIDTNNPSAPSDQIEFQPRLQDGSTPGIPNQGAVVTGAWQSWNALAGGWRSLFGPINAPLVTLATYAAAHPGARLQSGNLGPGMAILAGCDGARMLANVDDFRIAVNGAQTIFDFEVFPPVPAFEPWVAALLAIVLVVLGLHKMS